MTLVPASSPEPGFSISGGTPSLESFECLSEAARRAEELCGSLISRGDRAGAAEALGVAKDIMESVKSLYGKTEKIECAGCGGNQEPAPGNVVGSSV